MWNDYHELAHLSPHIVSFCMCLRFIKEGYYFIIKGRFSQEVIRYLRRLCGPRNATLLWYTFHVGEDSWESHGLQGDPTSPF